MNRLMFEIESGTGRQFGATHRGGMDGAEPLRSMRGRHSTDTGNFEHEISGRFSKLTDRVRVFVDVGAAEGWFSIQMRRNPEAKVFAFESVEDFSDSALTGFRHHGPIFLKINVDGDEIEALECARYILESPDTRAMIRVHDEPTESRCLRLLGAYGFNVEIVGPAWWRRAIVRDCRGEPAGHWLIAEKPALGGFHF